MSREKKCGAAGVFKHILSQQFWFLVRIVFYSIVFYSEWVKRKDTSIRLMMLWQVASVNPSNLISFPGGQKSISTRNQQEKGFDWVQLSGKQQTGSFETGRRAHVCWGHRSASAGAPGQRWPGPVEAAGDVKETKLTKTNKENTPTADVQTKWFHWTCWHCQINILFALVTFLLNNCM